MPHGRARSGDTARPFATSPRVATRSWKNCARGCKALRSKRRSKYSLSWPASAGQPGDIHRALSKGSRGDAESAEKSLTPRTPRLRVENFDIAQDPTRWPAFAGHD